MAKSARASSSAPGVFRQEFIPGNSETPSGDPAEPEKLSFWEQVASIPEDQWWTGASGEKGYKVYLYDLDQGGRYLEVITHPFEIEWVKKEKGGGTYRAQLNDPSGRIVASERFTIDGESKRKPPSVQNAPAAALPDPFQAQVLQIIQDGQRRLESFLERLITRDHAPATLAVPTTVDPTVMFKSMVEMFMGMMPKQQDPIALMIQLKELMGQPRDLLGDLAKLKEAGLIGGTGGDVLQQLTTVLKAAEMMGITGGRGGRSLGEALIEKAPDLLQAIGTGIDKYTDLEKHRLQTAQWLAVVQRNNQGGAQPAAQVAPAAVGAPRPAAVSPPGSGAQPVAQPLVVEPIGDQVIDQPEPTQGAIVAEMTEAQINTIKQKIVSGIARGMDGADIFGFINMEAPQFIEGFIMRDGSGVVRGVVTEEQLAAFCQHDAILKQATQYPRFRKSIKELLDEVTDFLGLGEEEEPQAPDQAVH